MWKMAKAWLSQQTVRYFSYWEARETREQCPTGLNSAIKRLKMKAIYGRPWTGFQETSAPDTEC